MQYPYQLSHQSRLCYLVCGSSISCSSRDPQSCSLNDEDSRRDTRSLLFWPQMERRQSSNRHSSQSTQPAFQRQLQHSFPSKSAHQLILLLFPRLGRSTRHPSPWSRLARWFPRKRNRTIPQTRSQQMAQSSPTPRAPPQTTRSRLERDLAAAILGYDYHLATISNLGLLAYIE